MGGTLFAQQQYPAALAKFSKALRYINVHPVLPDTHDAKAKPDFAAEYVRLKAVLYSNSAFCALKIADATPASAAGEVKAHARQAEEAAGASSFGLGPPARLQRPQGPWAQAAPVREESSDEEVEITRSLPKDAYKPSRVRYMRQLSDEVISMDDEKTTEEVCQVRKSLSKNMNIIKVIILSKHKLPLCRHKCRTDKNSWLKDCLNK